MKKSKVLDRFLRLRGLIGGGSDEGGGGNVEFPYSVQITYKNLTGSALDDSIELRYFAVEDGVAFIKTITLNNNETTTIPLADGTYNLITVVKVTGTMHTMELENAIRCTLYYQAMSKNYSVLKCSPRESNPVLSCDLVFKNVESA